MSQDILVPQQGGQIALPEYLQGSNFGVTDNLLQGMFQGGNRIGLRNSRFRLIVGGVEEGIIQENYLDTIILGAAPAVSRVYYQGNFDPNDNQPPSCYSADGVVPNDDVKSRQADKCAMCPQNVKGSKIVEGAKFKACSYFRRLVLMLAGDTEDRRIFKLDVKAQGLFGENSQNEQNLNDYIRKVATRGVDLGAVVTRISFDLNATVPKLLFKASRFITQEEMYAVEDLTRSEEVLSLKTVTMATLDLSNEETPANIDQQYEQYEQAEQPAPAPAPAPQRPAQQQRPAPAPAPARAPAPAPAPQRAARAGAPTSTQKPVVENNVPPPQRTQQPQRPAQQPAQRPASPAPQRPAQPARAPAPAPAVEAMSDDDLDNLLNSLE